MAVLIDSSAFYALACANDPSHAEAVRLRAALAARGEPLVTHSYVVGETTALLQRRLGLRPALLFLDGLAKTVELVWVAQALHDAGVALLRRRSRRPLSLTDCVSFALMRRRGINEAFAFDPDFAKEGFALVT